MSRTESSIFAKRSDWPRVFSKLGLVASSIGVFAFMPNARASDYSIAIGNGYQSVSRTPTGTGFGFLLDATRSGEDAYSIGSGLSFGVRIGAVSLTAVGKALHVRSADDRSGLTTPVGVIAGIPAASRLSLVARAFYTPRAVSAQRSVHTRKPRRAFAGHTSRSTSKRDGATKHSRVATAREIPV